MEKTGGEARFVGGLGATEARPRGIVVAVLAGLVNKQLVAELQALGARAVGLSGADGGLLRARRYDAELGFVGEVTEVAADALRAVIERAAIAVVAPIAIEAEGEALRPQLLNINADTAAGEVAAALAAERLVFLTDVAGVMDASGVVLAELDSVQAEELLRAGTISGGMTPKVRAGLRAACSWSSRLLMFPD